MSDNLEYKVFYPVDGEHTEIKRTKDDKTVAKVIGGEVKPTAPAYYKIKGELDEFWQGHLNAPRVDRFGELTENAPESREDDRPFDPAGPGEAPKFVEEPAEYKAEKPSKLYGMPKVDPFLGDLTPDFIVWLTKTDPEEAERRYGGTDNEVYENHRGQ